MPTYKSMQSDFSKDTIKDKLKDFKKLTPDKWNTIETGDFLRYFSNGEFRSGGHVKLNSFPDYIVLINYQNKATWCVQLKSATELILYVKTTKKIKSEKDKMKKVYELYKQGKLTTKS
tara:strand:+ start:1016 stop:1369 length:354 start_codon:yes stop_codon:yes gene_type:complete